MGFAESAVRLYLAMRLTAALSAMVHWLTRRCVGGIRVNCCAALTCYKLACGHPTGDLVISNTMTNRKVFMSAQRTHTTHGKARICKVYDTLLAGRSLGSDGKTMNEIMNALGNLASILGLLLALGPSPASASLSVSISASVSASVTLGPVILVLVAALAVLTALRRN